MTTATTTSEDFCDRHPNGLCERDPNRLEWSVLTFWFRGDDEEQVRGEQAGDARTECGRLLTCEACLAEFQLRTLAIESALMDKVLEGKEIPS